MRESGQKPPAAKHGNKRGNEKGLAFANPLMILVRPERFELPTPWFVAKYSIQMSYGRLRGPDYTQEIAEDKTATARPRRDCRHCVVLIARRGLFAPGP